jgi:predicted secreted protein
MNKKQICGLFASISLMGCLATAHTSASVSCGERITLDSKHRTFSVHLDGLPSAGYVWNITAQPQWLQLLHTESTSSELLGGPTKEIWTFRAIDEAFFSSQTGSLSLKRERPWEKNATDVQVCYIHLATHHAD